jgi:hypothetical protein
MPFRSLLPAQTSGTPSSNLRTTIRTLRRPRRPRNRFLNPRATSRSRLRSRRMMIQSLSRRMLQPIQRPKGALASRPTIQPSRCPRTPSVSSLTTPFLHRDRRPKTTSWNSRSLRSCPSKTRSSKIHSSSSQRTRSSHPPRRRRRRSSQNLLPIPRASQTRSRKRKKAVRRERTRTVVVAVQRGHPTREGNAARMGRATTAVDAARKARPTPVAGVVQAGRTMKAAAVAVVAEARTCLQAH